MKNYLLYFVLFGFLSCTTNKKAVTSPKEEVITKTNNSIEEVIYNFSDGSGNTYTVFPTEIKFEPMTPEMSSSGNYSGGEAKTLLLSNKQYNLIVKTLNQGINNKESHITEREMGSGLITKSTSETKNSYKISGKSEEYQAIDALLKILVP